MSGPADPDEVWDRYLRPARWPSWSPPVRAVRYPRELIVPGVAGTALGPAGLRVPFEVLEVDGSERSARRWVWRVRLGPVRLRMEHGVEPGPGGRGTLTWWAADGPAVVVAAYEPLVRVALRRLVRA